MAGPIARTFVAALIPIAAMAMPMTAAVAQDIPIADAEVAEGQLHMVHGDAQANIDPISDDVEALDRTQSIAWVQFDNWFSEDGAEIIAANIARDNAALIPLGF